MLLLLAWWLTIPSSCARGALHSALKWAQFPYKLVCSYSCMAVGDVQASRVQDFRAEVWAEGDSTLRLGYDPHRDLFWGFRCMQHAACASCKATSHVIRHTGCPSRCPVLFCTSRTPLGFCPSASAPLCNVLSLSVMYHRRVLFVCPRCVAPASACHTSSLSLIIIPVVASLRNRILMFPSQESWMHMLCDTQWDVGAAGGNMRLALLFSPHLRASGVLAEVMVMRC